ncbi:MAG TPA: efflux RND transporter periplasmic adaptor subunit [Luteolibacter sp.]
MRPIVFLPLSVIWLMLPSCGKKAPAAMPQMPPAAVTFVPAAEETVTITRDLPGRIDAMRVAEVRARVPGILLKRVFQEGADVKAGDVLFQIDPAPLIAARDSAAANLARAEANAAQSQNQVKRFRELIAVNAVSKQDADNAESAVAIADAEVLAARAAAATAELNLGYATVTAPISGRIGKAQVTEGALVGQNDATRLAIIQQLDPIYFDFTQSTTDLMAVRKALEGKPDGNKVTLLFDDGSEYGHPGKMLFSEVSVDQTTGMVSLRAEFPNPKHELLPGMFARARVVQAVKENAITIPQRALTRAVGGAGSVMVIDDSNHAQIRIVQTGEMTGDKWIVTSGLKAGERVIIEGLLKAKPGAPVVPELFGQPKTADAAATPKVEKSH